MWIETLAKINGKDINMKDLFVIPLSIFSLVWNIIDWQSINIVFTSIISLLTIIYLSIKIRSKYLELKDRKYSIGKYSTYIKRGPWIRFRKSKK